MYTRREIVRKMPQTAGVGSDRIDSRKAPAPSKQEGPALGQPLTILLIAPSAYFSNTILRNSLLP